MSRMLIESHIHRPFNLQMSAALTCHLNFLGLRNAFGLAEAGIAMMEYQIVIGEEREREEVGRSINPEKPGRL